MKNRITRKYLVIYSDGLGNSNLFKIFKLFKLFELFKLCELFKLSEHFECFGLFELFELFKLFVLFWLLGLFGSFRDFQDFLTFRTFKHFELFCLEIIWTSLNGRNKGHKAVLFWVYILLWRISVQIHLNFFFQHEKNRLCYYGT